MATTAKRRRENTQRAFLLLGLVAGGLFAGFPVLWMLSNSFKPNVAIFATPPKLISGFTTQAYKEIFTDPTKLRYFGNSYVVALSVTALTLLVGILAANVSTALADHTELPPSLVSQVDLGSVNFVSNERLTEVLAETDATDAQVTAAVAVNEEARLRALRLGLLILAGVSALAIVPASRLPRFRPGEIPESVATGSEPDPE
ncbi:MAG: carbohydrate ABC transporter permease [Microbacterium sp.]|nr:carbohydrate ABC transporter permease [Microbacterium sp.]